MGFEAYNIGWTTPPTHGHWIRGIMHHIKLEIITYTTFLVFVEDMENKDLEVHIGKHLSH